MRYAKIAVAIVLLALAVFALFRKKGDPLADGKRLTEVALTDEAAARKTVEKALAAIEKDDMNTLFSLMKRKDRMIFDSEYAEGMFATKDFTPAKIVGVTGLKREERSFAAVDMHSGKRDKDYRFILASEKGTYTIASIAER